MLLERRWCAPGCVHLPLPRSGGSRLVFLYRDRIRAHVSVAPQLPLRIKANNDPAERENTQPRVGQAFYVALSWSPLLAAAAGLLVAAGLQARCCSTCMGT